MLIERHQKSEYEVVGQLSSILASEIHQNCEDFCRPGNKLPGGWETEGVSLYLDEDKVKDLQRLYDISNIEGRVRVIAETSDSIRVIQYTRNGQLGIDILGEDQSDGNENWWPEGHRLSLKHAFAYLSSALISTSVAKMANNVEEKLGVGKKG